MAGDQDAALSAVGSTARPNSSTAFYRAQTPGKRVRRESFLCELLADLGAHPYTKATAMLAGTIDGERQSQGVAIPFGDLLIGAMALSPGFSVLTANLRHFQKIPGLTVMQL
jgi:tRNA(fMet)-specific endonuclease VapC